MYRRKNQASAADAELSQVTEFDRDLARLKRRTIFVPLIFLMLLEAVRRLSGSPLILYSHSMPRTGRNEEFGDE